MKNKNVLVLAGLATSIFVGSVISVAQADDHFIELGTVDSLGTHISLPTEVIQDTVTGLGWVLSNQKLIFAGKYSGGYAGAITASSGELGGPVLYKSRGGDIGAEGTCFPFLAKASKKSDLKLSDSTLNSIRLPTVAELQTYFLDSGIPSGTDSSGTPVWTADREGDSRFWAVYPNGTKVSLSKRGKTDRADVLCVINLHE
jgi:hypothetical protein